MGLLKHKGYTGSVEYSEEDNCLFGKVLGLEKSCISYEGESVDELREDFKAAVDDYILSCKERGVQPEEPFCGKVIVTMAPALHSKLATAAAEVGTSISDYVNRAVTRELQHSALL